MSAIVATAKPKELDNYIDVPFEERNFFLKLQIVGLSNKSFASLTKTKKPLLDGLRTNQTCVLTYVIYVWARNKSTKNTYVPVKETEQKCHDKSLQDRTQSLTKEKSQISTLHISPLAFWIEGFIWSCQEITAELECNNVFLHMDFLWNWLQFACRFSNSARWLCFDIPRYPGDPKKNVLQSGVTRSISLKTGHLAKFCSLVPPDFQEKIQNLKDCFLDECLRAISNSVCSLLHVSCPSYLLFSAKTESRYAPRAVTARNVFLQCVWRKSCFRFE